MKAVQEIVAQRFEFPTTAHPAYRAHANVPEVTMAVQVGDAEIAPDIVVVEKLNTGETHLVMTAAVAIREMVNEAEAARAWSRYASIPDRRSTSTSRSATARGQAHLQEAQDQCRGLPHLSHDPARLRDQRRLRAREPHGGAHAPLVRKLLATP